MQKLCLNLSHNTYELVEGYPSIPLLASGGIESPAYRLPAGRQGRQAHGDKHFPCHAEALEA
ncbi:TPA: hypothetical protein DF272_00675 [Candidatus Falkowbacteria bacterium]|nr:hypothetical protein [Candidatus Falkowbacteria bacterium]